MHHVHHNKLTIFQVTNTFNVAFQREYLNLTASIKKQSDAQQKHFLTRMKFPFFASVAASTQFANLFLENELVDDNLRELQTALLKRFFPDLLKQSETEIRQTAGNIVSLLKELILNKIVTQYEELLFIDFKHLLEAHDDEIRRYHHMQDEVNEYLKTYASEQTKNKDQLEACGERQTRTSGMSQREYASFLKREFEQNVHVIKRG